MEQPVSVQVTVRTAQGRVYGPYSIAPGTPDAPTPVDEYEKEGLERARADGLSEADAAGCTFDVQLPKDDDAR